VQFVEHPRYGQVYPFVTMNDKESWQVTAKTSAVALSVFNGSILYSTFMFPIYKASFAAVFANPLFVVPSLLVNYILYNKYYVYYYGDRCQIINMFLKPNGKQIIVETRDKESKVINITDIFDTNMVETRHEKRIDFGHGANNYMFIRGNAIIYDGWLLSSVLDNRFINCRNIEYDFDISKEFTWDFKELVEIKKRKRVVNRIIKPTLTSLANIANSRAFIAAKKRNMTVTKDEPHPNYNLYELFTDKHEEDKEKTAKIEAQYKWNLSNGGNPIVAARANVGGRRVKKSVK
jgi:hypothetical protein